MENQDQEVIKRLLEEDEGFRVKYKTHKEYSSKLDRMEKKPHLNEQETIEKNRLKKMKLALKDEMEKIIASHKRG